MTQLDLHLAAKVDMDYTDKIGMDEFDLIISIYEERLKELKDRQRVANA